MNVFFSFYTEPRSSGASPRSGGGRRLKPDVAFDPSSTSVAQTTHLCYSLLGFNYKLRIGSGLMWLGGWMGQKKEKDAGGKRFEMSLSELRDLSMWCLPGRRALSLTLQRRSTSKKGTHLSPAVVLYQPRPPGRNSRARKEEKMGSQIWDKDRTILRSHE